jgi:hypothetical protein
VELLFSIERALWIAAVLAEAAVLVRLFREGLVRSYPFFTAFLAALIVASLVMMRTDMRGRGYADVYRICELLMFVFRLGVAAELYERICNHFPGIGVFRAGMAAILILLAGVIAVFTFRPNLVAQWAFPQTLAMVVLRFQGEIFGGALLLTWIFLRFVLSIRQPFRPNVLTHWGIATIYFGANGAGYLAALWAGAGNGLLPLSCALLAVNIACFVAWYRLLRRSGEELPGFRRLSPEQAEAVERYNRTLLETVTSLPGEISVRQTENRDTPLHRVRQR